MDLIKTNDHWAFLEEIEAPMWVDLTLEEAKSNSQDIDDKWFCTSHLFHQCSSHQLKAAFSRSSGESVNSDLDLLGLSSPKLPSSVSRSRGKDYRSKNWRGDNCDVSVDKPHSVKVLSRKSSLVDLGSSDKIKPRSSFMKPKPLQVGLGSGEELKPKLSFVNPKGTSISKRSLVFERNSVGKAKAMSLKHIPSCGGLESASSSMVDMVREGSTGSTVTSESNLQGTQKFLETSSRAFGNTSGLLSAVRITLRKSCITRQASRVETTKDRRPSTMESNNDGKEPILEINNDGKESTMEINDDGKQSTMEINNDEGKSRDRKSSSSKSSVGSSSVPSFDDKNSTFITRRKKDKTPESRNVARKTEAPTKKVSNLSKVSAVLVKEGHINSRRGEKTIVSKSNYKETTKSKVQTHHAKSLLPLRVNEQNLLTGTLKARKKERFGGLNRLVGGGKENATVKLSANQKCNGRKNPSGGIIRSQNMAKQNVLQKGDTRGLAGPKEKIRDQSEGKNLMHVRPRVYLR